MTKRQPIPKPPYAGGCLCGAARYALTARPLAINACHCSDCKRLSGATHLLMLAALRAAFRHDSGTVARYRKRADSGRDVDVIRCSTCGTRLWHEPLSSPELVFVAVGTLDVSAWATPTSHIWVERAAPEFIFEPDAICVQGQPAARQVLFDAFDNAYGAR